MNNIIVIVPDENVISIIMIIINVHNLANGSLATNYINFMAMKAIPMFSYG